MNSREIVCRTIDFTGPERVARSFEPADFVSAGPELPNPLGEWRRTHGREWQRIDEWGNTWVRLDDTSKGEIAHGALEDLVQVDTFQFPNLDDPSIYMHAQNLFAENPQLWHIGNIAGFSFSIARKLRRMEQYLMDILLEPEKISRLHDRVDEVIKAQIRRLADAGADSIMIAEDWGTQTQLLISPRLWRQEFKPRFTNLCAYIHSLGMSLFMHSCGKMTVIIPDLIECGVDLLQFDQPRVHGIDYLASLQKANRITYWCPVDIQTTLQSKDAVLIRREARLMIDCLWRGRGGFIAGYYGDNASIGLDPIWQEFASQEFSEYGQFKSFNRNKPMGNWTNVVSVYEKLRADRTPLGAKFLSGERPYLIYQTPNTNLWGDMRTSEQSFDENIRLIQASLETPSDHLPVLEPWFGTGVYASMYGCDYVWRTGEAPAVHYKYHNIAEVRGLPRPGWQNSSIAALVLDTIRYFKIKTGSAIPIAWTDTQSASDTATLILDACEVFAACLQEPETIMAFMRGINQLIIEFSQVQSELIGDAGTHPGHIFLNNSHFGGLSVSDDNIPVGSPAVNRRFNLVLDEEIGRAFGGVAIHSCGRWTKTMAMVKEMTPSCFAIDLALDKDCDPDPNEPEQVRAVMQGSGICVHVRMTGETARMLDTVKRMLHPQLKLVVHPAFIDLPTAQRNYAELEDLLSSYYKVK